MQALAHNNTIEGWQPENKIKIYTSTLNSVAPLLNAEKAEQAFSPNTLIIWEYTARDIIAEADEMEKFMKNHRTKTD